MPDGLLLIWYYSADRGGCQEANQDIMELQLLINTWQILMLFAQRKDHLS